MTNKQQATSVIGIMSGTSLDGVDLVNAEFFQEKGQWQFAIKAAATFPFSEEWVHKLNKAPDCNGFDLVQLDVEFGQLLGKHVTNFVASNQIAPDLIASHGHTVFHNPGKQVSKQIGNGEALALSTGLPVVNDFRQADVLLGGQGAPLVPIGDELLFAEYNGCLNLGGIANISYKDEKGHRVAYDIAPCNLVLNHLARQLGHTYDAGGQLAKAGKVDDKLLETLAQNAYYAKTGPKSLDKSDVDRDWIALIDQWSASTQDKLATYVAHLAGELQKAFSALPRTQPTILITGGGAYNDRLIDKLEAYSNARLIRPENQLIEYKEALVFAFLGLLRMRNEVNCLSSVTGASRDHSAGVWHGDLGEPGN